MGLSVNNNPTSQDPFNTPAAWRFPFAVTSSSLSPTPGTVPVIDGALAGRVFGMTAYTFFDNGLYAEFGGYMPSSMQYQITTGVINDPTNPGQGITGFSPYWRLAYLKDMKSSMFSAGFFGMTGHLRTIATSNIPDRFMDWGFDANYQYLGTRKHVFAFGGSYTHENMSWGETLAANGGNASNSSLTLQEVRLNTSYHYDKTYGATIGFFDILGTADLGLYNSLGYSNDRPDSNGMVYQLDWTPFGKENSWGAYYANLRVGAQFTAYNKYNGSSAGASGNNTAFIFAWTAF